jgi:type 1 glutamine amidotransferase
VLAIRTRFIPALAPIFVGLALAACSSASPDGGGNTNTGGSSNRGGSGGSANTGGATPSGGSGAGSGGSGGAATGGSSGAGGSGGDTGTGGSTGSGGSSGTGGSGGTSAGGTGGSSPDANPGGDMGGGRPARVLLYTKRTNATHNASIPVATASLTTLLKAASIEIEASEATTAFTAANLARFGAVIMVNANGTPLGTPGTTEAGALADFVRAGGGLAAFHATGNTEYPGTHPFLMLLGGVFQNTGGGVRDVSCTPESQHPTVAKVPTPLPAPGDETYVFGNLNPMNTIVLRCDPAAGNTKQVAAWAREEGAGRVFYSTLGHGPPSWAAGGAVLTTHLWPGILWVLGR